MRKRIKGFTLIELLAVIVILAVILLIVVPIVLNVIGDARKGAFESSAMGLVKTAENACMSYALRHDPVARETLFSDGEMSGYELNFTGKPPVGGYVYINEQCEIQLAVHNNEWCAIKDYDELEVTLVPYDGECGINESVTHEPNYCPSITDDEIECLINGNCEGVILSDYYLGTEGSWIPVATAEELHQTRQSTNNIFGLGTVWEDEYQGGLWEKHYIQIADIDLSIFASWEPLNYFEEAMYDGGCHTISNLYINESQPFGFGLFDYVWESTIRNVVLHNSNFYNTEASAGGAIAATLDEAIIENVFAIDVSIISDYSTSTTGIGGLVGKNYSDAIIKNSHVKNLTIDLSDCNNCYSVGGIIGAGIKITIKDSSASNVSINAEDNGIGCLVGFADGLVLENSFGEGEVSGVQFIGGIIGYLMSNEWSNRSVSIKNSYSNCNLTGTRISIGGGIGVGYLYHSVFELENIYVTGEINFNPDPLLYQDWWDNYVGGFIGEFDFWPPEPYDYNSNKIKSVYYNSEKSGLTNGPRTFTINSGSINNSVDEASFLLSDFALPSSVEVVSDRPMPDFTIMDHLRGFTFATGTHCYIGENLGTFSSSGSWQNFQVANPNIVTNSQKGRINLYRNGIKDGGTNYQIPTGGNESGTIQARGTAGHSVTVDYCTTNIPVNVTYLLDPEWYGYPKMTLDLKQQSTYEGWDFTDVWQIDSSINNGYPYLINNSLWK